MDKEKFINQHGLSRVWDNINSKFVSKATITQTAQYKSFLILLDLSEASTRTTASSLRKMYNMVGSISYSRQTTGVGWENMGVFYFYFHLGYQWKLNDAGCCEVCCSQIEGCRPCIIKDERTDDVKYYFGLLTPATWTSKFEFIGTIKDFTLDNVSWLEGRTSTSKDLPDGVSIVKDCSPLNWTVKNADTLDGKHAEEFLQAVKINGEDLEIEDGAVDILTLDKEDVDDVVRDMYTSNTGVRTIREENVDCNVAHAAGWYQFSYPFLSTDTVKVYVDGTETTDFTTNPHGLVQLGSSFSSGYPEKIEAEYKLVSRLEQTCTIPFHSGSYGFWFRAFETLRNYLYLDWDGFCGKFEVVDELPSSIGRAEVALEYANFNNSFEPSSVYELGCDEFHEVFKIYLPDALMTAAISALKANWESGGNAWLQLNEIKCPSKISLTEGVEARSFTAGISWRKDGTLFFNSRNLNYHSDDTESYDDQGSVLTGMTIPTDQWVEVEIGFKVGPKGVGYLECKITDEEGNIQYYKDQTLDYCPFQIEEVPSSPKSQIDMPKAVSLYMDKTIFNAIKGCSEPYWKLKDFTATFYSHNKN